MTTALDGILPAPAARTGRRATVLLVLGALAGAGLAAREVVGERARIAPGVAASVDGVPILRDDLEQAIRAAETDRGTPLPEADRRHVLDRLVDEELLFSRALSLDLPRRDPRLRAEIVSALLTQVIGPAEGSDPTEAELARFFEENAPRFAGEPLVRVEALFFAADADGDVPGAEARARLAADRLRAGEPLARVAPSSDRLPVAVPAGLASRESLTAAIGPTAARTARELSAGATSDPVRTAAGFFVVRVVERRASPLQLADVRERVRAELVRRRGEERLRDAIAELRARADVRVSP